MKDRIKALMESQHMQQNVFANAIDINAGTLSGIFSERTKPTLNIVMAIKKRFPKINLEWLLDGTGPMFMSENTKADGTESAPSASVGSPSSHLPYQPVLFSDGETEGTNVGVKPTPNHRQVETVKIVEKSQRKITEIRIFYDDQTWETFVPKK